MVPYQRPRSSCQRITPRSYPWLSKKPFPWKKGRACPEIQETRCPRWDPIFKATSLQKEVKTGDAELARVQALMHDPVAPLIHLLHACDDVDTLISINEAKEAVVESISGFVKTPTKKVTEVCQPRYC